jgi:monofunctional glycosyltransferase
MPRSSYPASKKLPVDQFFDIKTFSSATAAAALLTVRDAPFARDACGSMLGLVARHWNGSSRRRAAKARRSRLARSVLASLRTIAAAHIGFILATSLLLVIFKTVNPGATTLMLYRHIDSGWKITRPRYVPLTKIPKSTRNMAVRVEDGNFYEHHGIMLAAIKNAYQLNKRFGEPIYGGSTITMQTARTIFLIPAKSYARKYLEVIIALEMEAILGKQRILELYFNYAEWGKGVFGIEAASRYHYKKGVVSLSRDQTIRLVTLLSSPIRYNPYSFGKNGILKSRYAYLDKRFGSGVASDLPPPPTVLPAAEAGPAPTTADTEKVENASGAQRVEGEGSEGGGTALPLGQGTVTDGKSEDSTATEGKANPTPILEEAGVHPSS